jgi:hypothetical protein
MSTASHPALLLRLRVRWSRRRLDREIAAGVDGERRAEIRLRCEQLRSAKHRRGVATAIRHVLEAADEPPSPLDLNAPAHAVNRLGVSATRDELIDLAEQLAGDAPMSARTVARAEQLAFGPSSPLCGGASPQALHAAITAVGAASRWTAHAVLGD